MLLPDAHKWLLVSGHRERRAAERAKAEKARQQALANLKEEALLLAEERAAAEAEAQLREELEFQVMIPFSQFLPLLTPRAPFLLPITPRATDGMVWYAALERLRVSIRRRSRGSCRVRARRKSSRAAGTPHFRTFRPTVGRNPSVPLPPILTTEGATAAHRWPPITRPPMTPYPKSQPRSP